MNIPYSDPDAVDRLLEDPVNRRLLEVLRLLVNESDSLAWASLLFLTAGIGGTFSDYIYHRARQQRCQFGEALIESYKHGFPNAPAAPARIAREMMASVLGWLEAHRPPEEGPEDGWGRWITEEIAGGNVAPKPTEESEQLLLALDDVTELDQELGRYLSQIAPLGKDIASAKSNGVRIMRMGGAKGLTVRATIIMATEDGLVPRPDCDLAEERRLLYVGMTRSREFLYCTWARRRTGPTARAGKPGVQTMRSYSNFFQAGPVQSQAGTAYIATQWE